MRTVVNFQFPIEPFNTLVRAGTAGKILAAILDAIKPEAVYFYAPQGCRGGTMVVNIDDPAQLPTIVEPFYLTFGAKCDVHMAMSPEDLAKAGLEELGKQWG